MSSDTERSSNSPNTVPELESLEEESQKASGEDVGQLTYTPMTDVTILEAENPTVEAQMFVDIGIPDVEELHSSESGSSTDSEGDALIPNFDMLDDTQLPSTTNSKKAQDTNDPQVLQRRARNRKAALVCRKKQKDKTAFLEEEVDKQTKEEERLKRQIQRTLESLNKYKSIWRAHLESCPIVAKRVERVKTLMQRRTKAGLARQNSGTFVPAI